MTGPRRRAAALAASLAVYAVPLVGPHAAWLLGEHLWHAVARGAAGRAGRDPWWTATDLAVALTAQAGLLALAFWFFGRPGWGRGLALAAVAVPGVIGLNYLYMVAIPTRFLLEADTAPERPGRAPICTARGVGIPPVAGPISGAGAGAIWVSESAPPQRYGLLDPSRCAVRWLDLAQAGMGAVTYAASGRAVYMTMTPATGRRRWSVFDAETSRQTPLQVDRDQAPILSSDGRWAAWLRPVAGAAPPIQLEAVLSAVDGSRERVVPLTAVGAGSLQILEVDAAAGALVVARGLADLSVVDLDGGLRETLPVPPGVALQPSTYRLVGGAPGASAPRAGDRPERRWWVAWDAYREDGRYRVVWALPGGAGAHRVAKGRSVTALAPSPDGRSIAVSVTSTLSIGATPDAVYVLRAADGSEAFRRYLPKYTRAGVDWAGPGRLVYSDLEGVQVVAIE